MSHLPNPDDGVGYENEQNNKRLHKRRDGFFSLLKPGQDLKAVRENVSFNINHSEEACLLSAQRKKQMEY